MKTQILIALELEFDTDAARRRLGPDCSPPTPAVMLEEVNSVIREWIDTNPYILRDKNHLTARLSLKALENPVLTRQTSLAAGNEMLRLHRELGVLAKQLINASAA